MHHFISHTQTQAQAKLPVSSLNEEILEDIDNGFSNPTSLDRYKWGNHLKQKVRSVIEGRAKAITLLPHLKNLAIASKPAKKKPKANPHLPMGENYLTDLCIEKSCGNIEEDRAKAIASIKALRENYKAQTTDDDEFEPTQIV